MDKLTVAEIYTLVERYGYDIIIEGNNVTAKKRDGDSRMDVVPSFYGENTYWGLSGLIAWIIVKESNR